MSKREVVMSPAARDGLTVLGQQIRIARTERRWTLKDVATRALISVPTLRAIEEGAPGTAVGTVFHVAGLVGIPIFGIEDRTELARRRRQGEDTLALLPERVRTAGLGQVRDDF